MKRERRGLRSFSFAGALIFFAVIALVIQIAVLLFDYIEERTESNLVIAVLMLNVILLLAAVCTVADIIRRRVTVNRPVRRILEATEAIAAGDLGTRLTVSHPWGHYTEYDLIAENLNQMAEELERSVVLRTDFISNVSHELKTPLAVIGNYAALLSDESLDKETRRRYTETLRAASARLSDLITNILKLNKLENGELSEGRETFDLAAALAEHILSYEELLEKRELLLECDLPDTLPITSSRGYLEIVFHNLISNAIKFTEAGGTVRISLGERDGRAVLTVSDTGCGISPEVGAHIFEKFYQGDTSHAMQGNGLGLALVKRVVDIMQGEIAVESETGKGSTFTVRLKRGDAVGPEKMD